MTICLLGRSQQGSGQTGADLSDMSVPSYSRAEEASEEVHTQTDPGEAVLMSLGPDLQVIKWKSSDSTDAQRGAAKRKTL